MDLLPAQGIAPRRGLDRDWRWAIARGDSGCRLPKQGPQLPLELADARLARVAGDDQAQHSVLDRYFVHAQTVPFDLARPQIAASDRDLLFGRVAIEADHFHTVEQWSWNGLGHVRCGNEQHMREIELDIQVMIL